MASLFFPTMYSCTKAQLKCKSSRCVFYHKVSDSVHGTKKSEEWCLALEQEAIIRRVPPKPNERCDLYFHSSQLELPSITHSLIEKIVLQLT